MGLRQLSEVEVAGKRVLLRVDYNVPVHDGEILDDRRIRATLPTIGQLVGRGAKVIVVTHRGRPKGHYVEEQSVVPVARRLGDLLGCRIVVASDVAGDVSRRLVDEMNDGDILMLENVRFEPGEETNDPEFAARLASLADVYVNDAFATAHRAHASTEGIARHLPAAAGLLLAREVDVLSRLVNSADHPLVAVIGGAKVGSKIGVIRHLLTFADSLYIGGAMACPFYVAKGARCGTFEVSAEEVEIARGLLADEDISSRIVLPSDAVVARSVTETQSTHVVAWDAIPDDEMTVDVGPATLAALIAACEDAATVVWNGPLGIYEIAEFAKGTTAFAKALANVRATTVVGGGDCVAAVEKAGVSEQLTHVSTGGGATLEFLEGKLLPGVAALALSLDVP